MFHVPDVIMNLPCLQQSTHVPVYLRKSREMLKLDFSQALAVRQHGTVYQAGEVGISWWQKLHRKVA